MNEHIKQLIAAGYRVFSEVHSEHDAWVGITKEKGTVDGVHFCEVRFRGEDLETTLNQAIHWVQLPE